jgi:hypothetical protein
MRTPCSRLNCNSTFGCIRLFVVSRYPASPATGAKVGLRPRGATPHRKAAKQQNRYARRKGMNGVHLIGHLATAEEAEVAFLRQ